MLVAALGEPCPERLRGRVAGEGCGADRLAEERGHRLRARLREHAVEGLESRFAARVEAPGRGRDVEVGGQIRRVVVVQARPAREREGDGGRPVVGLRGGDDAPSLRLAALDVVAPSEADRGLVGLGPARHEVHAREALRSERDQLAGEVLLRLGRELLVVEKRDPGRLGAGRLDELRDAVADARHHRSAADRVEVARTRGVVQPDAFGSIDQRVGPVELTEEDARIGLADEDGPAHVDLPHHDEITRA